MEALKNFSLKIKKDYELSFGFERDEPEKEKLFELEENDDYEIEM